MKFRIFCLILMVFLSLPVHCEQTAGNIEETNLKEINWSPYMTALEKKIKDGWNKEAHKNPTEIVAGFSIKKTGEIENVLILKPSGDKDSDSAALKAIKDASPAPSLPEEYKEPFLVVQYVFESSIKQPQTPAKPSLIDNFRKLNSDYYLRYQSKNPWL